MRYTIVDLYEPQPNIQLEVIFSSLQLTYTRYINGWCDGNFFSLNKEIAETAISEINSI